MAMRDDQFGDPDNDTLVLPLTDDSARQGARQAAPGWYPDPASSPVLRYWDGRAWTATTTRQSATPSRPARCSCESPDLADLGLRRKSSVVAFLLVCFFGPFGLFYISPLTGAIALLAGIALWQLLGWFALLAYPLLWMGSLVYAPIAANSPATRYR